MSIGTTLGAFFFYLHPARLTLSLNFSPSMKVYFISGLGADKSVFSFLDLSFCEPIFIEWITPEKKETLAGYALRLAKIITDEKPVIVGLSFGGMLATEIAKANPVAKIILISSAKTVKEIPPYYFAFKNFPIAKILKSGQLKKLFYRLHNLFGAQKPEAKKIVRKIFDNLDMNFTVWAIDAILHWNNTTIPPNIVHIHGTHDKVLPKKFVSCNHAIKGGGHLMVLEQPEEISELLKKIIIEGD